MFGHERSRAGIGLPVMIIFFSAGFASAGVTPERILERTNARRGIVVVLGDPTGQFALDLAREPELLVYMQLPDRENVDRARRAAAAARLDASRFHVPSSGTSRPSSVRVVSVMESMDVLLPEMTDLMTCVHGQ